MTDWHLCRVSILPTIACCSFGYSVSQVVGFPVPFTHILSSTPGPPVLFVLLLRHWRPILHGDTALQQSMRRQIWVLLGQVAMIWIYPPYLFAFTAMNRVQQSVFTFVLPIIKLSLNNYFSRFLYQLDDLKPAFIVFNADLFNALYATNCLQTSQSWTNTLMVMVVDIIQMAISMYDVRAVMKAIHSLVRLEDFDGSLLDLCVEMAESPDVRNELDRRQPSSRSVLSTLHWSGPYSAQCKVTPSAAPRSSSVHTASRLSSLHRRRLASKITRVLYIAEFVLLIEFVEVMIPVIQRLYLGAMSHLPNRAFYPQLAALSEEELIKSISTVMLNAGLAFISFLVACWLLHRQLRLSSLHLLGFVLESQRSLIQPSLMIWTVYMIQQSLIHTGVDFTLRFAWLHNKST